MRQRRNLPWEIARTTKANLKGLVKASNNAKIDWSDRARSNIVVEGLANAANSTGSKG